MTMKAKMSVADWVIIVIIGLVTFLCLVPFLHILAMSLSSTGPVLSGRVTIFPLEVTLQAYNQVFQNASMIHSLVFTILLVVVFTLVCMLTTTLAAYPLAKRDLRGRRVIMFIIVFTMFFDGGIIPNYILVRQLHLLDTMWSLILPGMVSAFYLIIMISFFRSIPDSLIESAEIDGSSQFGILIRIVLPLSLPVIATLSLFYAVGRWNGFQDSLLYINSPNLYPIQLRLYELIMNNMASTAISAEEGSAFNHVLPDTLKAADVMFATLPILLAYPWLQRYFISGMMLGSVKE